ncbi:hypothetical protein BN1723_017454, partial [Verticillium longisporum]
MMSVTSRKNRKANGPNGPSAAQFRKNAEFDTGMPASRGGRFRPSFGRNRSSQVVNMPNVTDNILEDPLMSFQQTCIPQALLGGDIICQAKSGLGKTAVFVLTTLQQVEPVAGEVSVLVMCHTRELAFQIRNEYNRFSKYMPDIKTGVFYG